MTAPVADEWAAVEGVTLDEYARLCAGLHAHAITGTANVHAWVEGQGVRPGTWPSVVETWNARLREHAAVREHYARRFGGG